MDCIIHGVAKSQDRTEQLSLVAQMVKEFAYNAGDLGSIPGSGRTPREENATHSSILVWRIPWTEEPDGLQ